MSGLLPQRQTLQHEAMATRFSLTLVHEDPRYARQAAAAAFAELDRIEGHLSRFVATSDVCRLQQLRPGETAVVALDTFRCLAVALELQRQTAGAFDVTYRSASSSLPEGRLRLDSRTCAVTVLTEGVEIDLGGIGKGFALDVMADVLRQWEVDRALLAASTSTVLALRPPLNAPGWAVQLGPERDLQHRTLAHAACSGSGISVHGRHIVDPRQHRPAQGSVSSWALAPTGAEADALSTAFMIMSAEEIRRYCHRHPGVSAYVLALPDDRLLALGG
jgi:thiamine biosynthesis lipoprotein